MKLYKMAFLFVYAEISQHLFVMINNYEFAIFNG